MDIIELTQDMIVDESGKQAVREFLHESIYLNQFDDNELDYLFDINELTD